MIQLLTQIALFLTQVSLLVFHSEPMLLSPMSALECLCVLRRGQVWVRLYQDRILWRKLHNPWVNSSLKPSSHFLFHYYTVQEFKTIFFSNKTLMDQDGFFLYCDKAPGSQSWSFWSRPNIWKSWLACQQENSWIRGYSVDFFCRGFYSAGGNWYAFHHHKTPTRCGLQSGFPSSVTDRYFMYRNNNF